jgi:hypothetical protein
MLWACAQRAGLQDGFVLQDVNFVNPFERTNSQLIDQVLPPS